MASSAGDTFTKVVAPTLGLILSNAMFLAPLAQVQAARRSGSLGALNPLPFVAIFLNCCLWGAYGCLKQDFFVFFSNSQGVALGVWFTLSCLPLLDAQGRRSLERAFLAVVCALVFIAFLAGLALPDPQASTRLVAGCATFAAIAYYAAPLSTLWEVLKTRNASSLSLPLCLASLANAAMWTTYGAAVQDYAIMVPNLPGIGAGALQLALLARFGRGVPQAGPPQEAYSVLGEAEAGGVGGVTAERDGAALLRAAPAGFTTAGAPVGPRTLSPRRSSGSRD